MEVQLIIQVVVSFFNQIMMYYNSHQQLTLILVQVTLLWRCIIELKDTIKLLTCLNLERLVVMKLELLYVMFRVVVKQFSGIMVKTESYLMVQSRYVSGHTSLS